MKNKPVSKETDDLLEFKDKYLVVTGDKDRDYVPCKHVYGAYIYWCEVKTISWLHKKSRVVLYKQLAMIPGVSKSVGTGGLFFYGLRLNEDMKTTERCPGCGKSLPLYRFYQSKKDGPSSECKRCLRTRARDRRAEDDHSVVLKPRGRSKYIKLLLADELLKWCEILETRADDGEMLNNLLDLIELMDRVIYVMLLDALGFEEVSDGSD